MPVEDDPHYKQFLDVQNHLIEAQDRYYAALKAGGPGGIAAAKIDLDKAQAKYDEVMGK